MTERGDNDEFALTPTEPTLAKEVKGRIDIVGEFGYTSLELGWFELWGVANNFTREGIASWLDTNHSGAVGNVAEYGWIDFHAIWGDKEVPWATDAARAMFE
jgi:hypothetical protein